MSKCIVGIDPGGTIGMAVFYGKIFSGGYEFSTIEEVLDLLGQIAPDQVVCEDYILSGRPGQAIQGKVAVKQIGVLEHFCREREINLAMQSPSLLQYGLKHLSRINTGTSKHIASAAAHAVVWGVKNHDAT